MGMPRNSLLVFTFCRRFSPCQCCRHRLTLAPCLCSVDASACALLSEDYPGTTRWHLQRELVACHSQACFSGGSDSSRTARSQEQKVVLIAGSDGRASVTLHPTAEGAALQRALDAVRPSGEGNLVAALKLALVSPGRAPHCIPNPLCTSLPPPPCRHTLPSGLTCWLRAFPAATHGWAAACVGGLLPLCCRF